MCVLILGMSLGQWSWLGSCFMVIVMVMVKVRGIMGIF